MFFCQKKKVKIELQTKHHLLLTAWCKLWTNEVFTVSERKPAINILCLFLFLYMWNDLINVNLSYSTFSFANLVESYLKCTGASGYTDGRGNSQISGLFQMLDFGLVGLTLFNATFNNISAISWWYVCVGWGNLSIQRKPPTSRKSLTNFIT